MSTPAHFTVDQPIDRAARRAACDCLLPGDSASAERLFLAVEAREGGWESARVCRGSGGRVIGASLILERPGGAGTMVLPRGGSVGWEAPSAAAARASIAHFLKGGSDRVIIALTAAAGDSQSAVLQAAGMDPLTTLSFLERKLSSEDARDGDPEEAGGRAGGVRVAPLPRDPSAILSALERTYEGSMDCPELTARRSASRVLESHLEGHTEVPRTWLGLRVADSLAGLSLVRARAVGGGQSPTWDLIYLGLAPECRGRGLGDHLLRRTITQLAARRSSRLSLACDVRNRPALNLYWRHGFREVEQRMAWINRDTTSVVHKL